MPNSCKTIIHRMLHKGAMTQEEHDKIIRKLDFVEARTQMSSADLISRQAAIKWCRPEEWGTPDERWRPESEFGAMLEALPSAQPVAKEGRWIDMDDHVMCSCCGATHYGADKNYCPNCGARMIERGEEENDF